MKKASSCFLFFILLFLWSCNSLDNEIFKEPSYDNNLKNSGILYQISDGGFIITESAAKRYIALVKKYGKTFVPELTQKDISLKLVYYITDDDMENFLKLNYLNKTQ